MWKLKVLTKFFSLTFTTTPTETSSTASKSFDPDFIYLLSVVYKMSREVSFNMQSAPTFMFALLLARPAVIHVLLCFCPRKIILGAVAVENCYSLYELQGECSCGSGGCRPEKHRVENDLTARDHYDSQVFCCISEAGEDASVHHFSCLRNTNELGHYGHLNDVDCRVTNCIICDVRRVRYHDGHEMNRLDGFGKTS